MKYMRYKFRYYNGTFKLLNGIIVPLTNFVYPQFFVLLFARFIALIGLGQYFNNDVMLGIIQKAVVIISFLWPILYCVLPKGVFLYDDKMVIARYTITTFNWKNRITINYDEIENVDINYTNLIFNINRCRFLVPFGDSTYNIELTMKNGRKYFFSIQEQEEFVYELNSRIIQDNQRQSGDGSVIDKDE